MYLWQINMEYMNGESDKLRFRFDLERTVEPWSVKTYLLKDVK